MTDASDRPADGGPAPTIIVLTEEALKPVDVEKIVALHEEDAPTYRVLVPADTDRNMLSASSTTSACSRCARRSRR